MRSSEGIIGMLPNPLHCIACGPTSQLGDGTPHCYADTSVAGRSGSFLELHLDPPSLGSLNTIEGTPSPGGELWGNITVLMLRKVKRQRTPRREPHPAGHSPQGRALLGSHWKPLCQVRAKWSMSAEMHLSSSGILVLDMAAHALDTVTSST